MDLVKIEKRKVSVLIPYYIENDKAYVFLQKRGSDAKRLPSFYGFFGGGADVGESPEMALKREIKEELCIDVSDYSYFGHYEFYGAIMDVYMMLVDKDFTDKVKVIEGEYGKFMDESDVANEPLIYHQDRSILANFFGKMDHGDPYFFRKV